MRDGAGLLCLLLLLYVVFSCCLRLAFLLPAVYGLRIASACCRRLLLASKGFCLRLAPA